MRVEGKNRKLEVNLNRRDRLAVTLFLKEGGQPLKIFRRAQVLHLLHLGKPPQYIANILRMSAKGVRAIGWRYREGDLLQALYGLKRGFTPRKISESQRVSIWEMMDGPPPNGFPRWTIRLATAEALRLNLVTTLSRETMRLLLKSKAHTKV